MTDLRNHKSKPPKKKKGDYRKLKKKQTWMRLQMRKEPSWRPWNQNRKRRVKRCGWRFKNHSLSLLGM